VAKDGTLLFSEDGNGTIWLVSYTNKLNCSYGPDASGVMAEGWFVRSSFTRAKQELGLFCKFYA